MILCQVSGAEERALDSLILVSLVGHDSAALMKLRCDFKSCSEDLPTFPGHTGTIRLSAGFSRSGRTATHPMT